MTLSDITLSDIALADVCRENIADTVGDTTTTGPFTFQAGRCYPQSGAPEIRHTSGAMSVELMKAGTPQQCYDWCTDNSGVDGDHRDPWTGDPVYYMGLELRHSDSSSYSGHSCMCNRPGGQTSDSNSLLARLYASVDRES